MEMHISDQTSYAAIDTDVLSWGSLEERERKLGRSDEDQSKGFRKDDGRDPIPRLLLCLMQQHSPE